MYDMLRFLTPIKVAIFINFEEFSNFFGIKKLTYFSTYAF